MKSIRIATRNSPLALWQANYVKDQLQNAHSDLLVEIVSMTTRGDQLLDRSLIAAGGKGLFLKELEVSLLNNETDIAVHSMKDVPVDLPRGLEISVVCEREDARDAFVSNNYQNLYALPKGAKVGTSSLRRVAQLKNAFPSLEFIELRGNVNTRLRKLDNDDYDAIILAAAGLIRLDLHHRIKQYISPELCLPAVGQGVVGIECRSDDDVTKSLLAALHSKESALTLAAERAMNAGLEGGCQVPIAGYAQIANGKIRMRGMVGDPDGSNVLRSETVSTTVTESNARTLGEQIADDLLLQGAGEILASVYDKPMQLKKLSKPMVLLTRQHRYLGNTAAILQRLDFQPTHVPTLSIEPEDGSELLEFFGNLSHYTDLLFVSRNAVEVGMSMIQQQGGMPEGICVMAVGGETAKQLFRFGINAMFPSQGSGAEALLKVSQLQKMDGRRVLVIRGEQGLSWPAEEMRKRGATVDEVSCYKQTVPSTSAEQLLEALEQNHQLEGIFVHSSQSLQHLMIIAGDKSQLILQATLVAGSQAIAETATSLGWLGVIRIAESPSNKHMMMAFSG
ncbi:MAG: hydroxymethylbilane synthase [Arenicella sp.]|jgi:hydroxymethylbilane synthase